MKSKCLRGKRLIEVKVDENQTFGNIEFLICILAKNLYSLSLPVMLFIWRYSDGVWLPYSSCQDGDMLWGEVISGRLFWCVPNICFVLSDSN